MKAIGGYLRGMRLEKRLTLLDVAMAMAPFMGDAPDPSYIQKIEKGTIRTSPSFKHVYAALSALGGSSVVMRWLFADDEASQARGEEIGRRHAQYRANDLEWLEGLTPEERSRLRAMFDADEIAGV